jgi:hypothetical protein
MSALAAVLMSSVLWLCPILVEAGTTGEQRPEQPQLLTKDNLKLVQERLQREGVYAGPVDGELNAQTEAARRGRPVPQPTTAPHTTKSREPPQGDVPRLATY